MLSAHGVNRTLAISYEWLRHGRSPGFKDILLFEEEACTPAFHRALRRLRQSPEGRRMLADKPEIRPGQVDFKALARLPAETFGGAFARHLDLNGITPQFATPIGYLGPYTADPELGWLKRRYRQLHDVWHVLLNLGISPHEEVILHAFGYAQLQLPLSALILSVGSLAQFVRSGRWDLLFQALPASYRNGQRCPYLLAMRVEDYWDQPLAAVRADFGITPLQIRLP